MQHTPSPSPERSADAALTGRVSRRDLLKRAAALGLGASALGTLLAACGGGAATPNPGASATNTTAPAASTSAATVAPTSAATRAGATSSPATSGGAGAASPAATGTRAPSSAASPASSGAAKAPAPAGKKDLVIATGGDITTLDPHLSTAGNDPNVSFNIYDQLLYRDAEGKQQPMLATEWKSLDDMTWQFKLRQGVKFHNGDPFSAEDVKFTIERTYDPNAKTVVATVFASVASIETPDPNTVVFKTKAPDPLLPARLSFYGGQMMPKKYFTDQGPEKFNQKPVGCGPLKFVEWIKDDRLVLEADKNYWGGPIAVDRVIWRPRPETAARIGSLLSGEADLALNVPPDQIDQINKSGKARTESALYGGLYVLAVNSKVPLLAKPEMKQALAYAIDRKTIIETIWRGQGIAPSGMIPRDSFAFDANLPAIPYDPNKAKDLLKKAGYANEEVYIETTQGYIANDRQMSEAIAQMWQAIGVNVKIEVIEVSVRAQKNREKSFKGMFWSDPTDTFGDPAGMAWRLLGPGGPQDYWRDARWDELGKEANTTLDQTKRKKNYDEMNQIFLQNFPWIPVLQPYQAYGLANYVGWRPYSSTYFNLRKENLKLGQ